MNQQFLEFEQPIAELEAKIHELRLLDSDASINISEEIARLEKKCTDITKTIFSKLTTWQKVQVARHPLRPYTADYIDLLFTEFDELHGDRHSSAGAPIMGGMARLDGKPVMVIGHQKGRKTSEKLHRNFGLATPEAYRKALRLMKMAEKFQLPIVTFIDTQGAYPGITAEEHNQSEAIARNLFEMSTLATRIVCVVIGEGGSGGALAIGVGDRMLMLEYSIYSVISPEGCASILWKSADKRELAAEQLGLSADRLYQLGLIDQIIDEPLGGAHRNADVTAGNIKRAILDNLAQLEKYDLQQLLKLRYQRLMGYGIAN
jgi:acetyl-CoA carboxylase carboxyl transferase subunit alpha